MKRKHLNTCLLVILLAVGVIPFCAQGQKARIDSHIHLYDTNREGSFSFLDGQKNNPNSGLLVPHLQQQFLNAAQPSGFEDT